MKYFFKKYKVETVRSDEHEIKKVKRSSIKYNSGMDRYKAYFFDPYEGEFYLKERTNSIDGEFFQYSTESNAKKTIHRFVNYSSSSEPQYAETVIFGTSFKTNQRRLHRGSDSRRLVLSSQRRRRWILVC